MGFLNFCCCLVGELSLTAQNGNSLWGTLLAQTLPPFMLGNGGFNVIPWGDRGVGSSNPYTDAPHTGITRRYEFNVSRGIIAPDGYQKDVLLVNDQFPGPLVEANWGDYIEVKVTNSINDGPPEGTAIHWHGFLQTGTPWMDGVPGVSQCPIAPGKSFTYKFRAELYGSSWYHSHYSAQYAGGLFGPIVVHGPRNADYDVDLGPVMVNDWSHRDYYAVVQEIMGPGSNGLTSSDNNLINGKMNFDCSTVDADDETPCTDNAGLSKFIFTPGKTHRLRFINSGAEGTQRISIDGHNMTVIANDFVPIKPYDTQVITLGVGQRTDVIVHAHADPGSAFWLRANMTSCSSTKQPLALAAIYYQGADNISVPDSTPWDVPDPGTCENDDLALTVPSYPIALPEPSWTQHMDVSAYINSTGSFLWEFGGVAARVDYNNPTLLQARRKGGFEYTAESNLINYGTNSSIRIIVNNPAQSAHPIHAHGLHMYVLATGPGNYTENALSNLNTKNPMRRDVQMVGAYSYVVVQLDASKSPGIWPFHCHVAWHSSAGFFSQMLFKPDELLTHQYDIPHDVSQTCRDWNDFTNGVVPNQIDSGLKARAETVKQERSATLLR
ncbi:putative multicopper oxidase [Daldinia vernicosa]|uniref:putative multicopper oxidase n=1 Tax=Daldinia vernicosa TaxID=114800 RepID=UPI002008BB20|nr:putative multicopper oxidase [Daldinia vernicosa]KAI0848477.1 putative multicopper oxidase [Daldinia vernicosa]